MQVIHTQLVKLFISITIWRVLQAVCEWLMLFLTDIPWWRRAAVRPTLLIDLHNTNHMIRHWSIRKTRTHIQRFLIITSAIVIGVRPRKICHWRRSCPAAVQRDLPVCEGVSSWIVSSNVLEHFKAGVRLGNIYDASHFMTWDIHTYLQQAVLPAFFHPGILRKKKMTGNKISKKFPWGSFWGNFSSYLHCAFDRLDATAERIPIISLRFSGGFLIEMGPKVNFDDFWWNHHKGQGSCDGLEGSTWQWSVYIYKYLYVYVHQDR